MTTPIENQAYEPISHNTVKIFGIMAAVSIIPMLSFVMYISAGHNKDSVTAVPVRTEATQIVKQASVDGEKIAIETAIKRSSGVVDIKSMELIGSGNLYKVNVNENVLYFTGDGTILIEGYALNTLNGERYEQSKMFGAEPVSMPAPVTAIAPVQEAPAAVAPAAQPIPTPAPSYVLQQQATPVSEEVEFDVTVATEPTEAYTRFPDTLAIMTGDVGAPMQVAVFTDPDCPYCRQFEASNIEFEGVEFANMLYPIEELHPGATDVSKNIWCSADPRQAFMNYMANGDKSALQTAPADCETPISNIAKAGDRAGVNGTPTFLSLDGRILEGYPGPVPFMKWINNN